jgi:FtsP/CotA-like multicopper oxidase with cupredoxin domain
MGPGMQLSRRGFVGALGLAVVRPRLTIAEESTDGFQVLRAQKYVGELLENTAIKTLLWRFSIEERATVLRARQGSELKVRIINNLEREIWFHWFGVRGPSELMTLNIQPGDENAVDCVFIPPDAGTFWFGPLTDASRQRGMGLYGMLIVEERQLDPALIDIPLLIDDWKIGDDGKIEESFGDLQVAVGEGRLGNWFTVNGAYLPRIKLPADKPCRLRVLNASNARSMELEFKGLDPLVVALDGQPISPRHGGVLGPALQPGQRVDFVLDTGREDVAIALDISGDIVEVCYLEREGGVGSDTLPDNFSLPINPIMVNLDMEKARTIPVVIAGGAKGGLKSATFKNSVLDMRTLLEQGIAWAINGVAGPGGDMIGNFVKGETIILDIDNATNFDQPLHIHGHVWQVIEQGGVLQEGQPWRDTILVPRMQKQKAAFVADNPGIWALQSLVAERVDSGLIASFAVQ